MRFLRRALLRALVRSGHRVAPIPARNAAPPCAWGLQGLARFIVVHDTETEPDQVAATVYAFEGVFARFRFRTDYRVFKPFTTILSDESPFELTAAEAVR